MRFISVFIFFLLQPSLWLQAQTPSAADVMRMVDQRYTGDTKISDSVLVLIDKKGRQRSRELKLYGKSTQDIEKTLVYFLAPADVKGTSYMSHDWKDSAKEDKAWLYLPALQKVKRVSSAQESGSFMGSDFTYADINGLNYDDFSYQFLALSEYVDGQDCWVIEAHSKDERVINKTGYLKFKAWIRKDNYFQVKSVLHVKKGKRIKYFSARDIKKEQGIWVAHSVQMITTRNEKKEHSSVIKISDVTFNKPIDEGFFNVKAMQRGL